MEQPDHKVIRSPELFKIKLGIGEAAYKFLRVQNNLTKYYDVISTGLTGSGVAASSVVANTFFAKAGILAWIGIGTAATPIGWVVAAGIASGVAYYGISNIFKKNRDGKVTVIPNFINTPLDLLAVGIVNLILPVALKVAHADNRFGNEEREHIMDYFVDEWGFEKEFMENRLNHLDDLDTKESLHDLTMNFTAFTHKNQDCNREKMSTELIAFLEDLARCDRIYHPNEQAFIAHVQKALNHNFEPKFLQKLKIIWSSILFTFQRPKQDKTAQAEDSSASKDSKPKQRQVNFKTLKKTIIEQASTSLYAQKSEAINHFIEDLETNNIDDKLSIENQAPKDLIILPKVTVPQQSHHSRQRGF